MGFFFKSLSFTLESARLLIHNRVVFQVSNHGVLKSAPLILIPRDTPAGHGTRSGGAAVGTELPSIRPEG